MAVFKCIPISFLAKGGPVDAAPLLHLSVQVIGVFNCMVKGKRTSFSVAKINVN